MGGVPGLRIVQFDLGNLKGKYQNEVRLLVKEACQVRHTALEAARIAANRHLHRFVGAQNYHLKVLVFPHQVLRENKVAVGAGADRVSQGMRRAFGKAVGTAARVDRRQAVMFVRVNDQHVTQAKEALKRANMKLPAPCSIEIIPVPE